MGTWQVVIVPESSGHICPRPFSPSNPDEGPKRTLALIAGIGALCQGKYLQAPVEKRNFPYRRRFYAMSIRVCSQDNL